MIDNKKFLIYNISYILIGIILTIGTGMFYTQNLDIDIKMSSVYFGFSIFFYLVYFYLLVFLPTLLNKKITFFTFPVFILMLEFLNPNSFYPYELKAVELIKNKTNLPSFSKHNIEVFNSDREEITRVIKESSFIDKNVKIFEIDNVKWGGMVLKDLNVILLNRNKFKHSTVYHELAHIRDFKLKDNEIYIKDRIELLNYVYELIKDYKYPSEEYKSYFTEDNEIIARVVEFLYLKKIGYTDFDSQWYFHNQLDFQKIKPFSKYFFF